MKLNGLTNNLKDDKSLSTSYLQHIVELLRKELETLQIRFNKLDKEATDHIETQKTLVKTVQVEADNINDKIHFLTNAIEMFGTAKLNGHNILTDEQFTGPFTYKGRVPELPALPVAGDVYAVDNTIYVWNGTSYDIFDIPVGTVSKTEYDQDQIEIKQDISDNTSDIAIVKEDLLQMSVNTGVEISKINTALDNTVTKNPVDNNTYVRKNDEWVDLNTADNTVKSIAGESVISNENEGVTITSPKVEINSDDIKVNGTTLTQADKFSLSTTNKSDNTVTYYELQYKKNPFSSYSSDIYGYTVYKQALVRFPLKTSLNAKFTVTTRDYQYRKTFDQETEDENSCVYLTSLDKDGNIKPMYLPTRQINGRPTINYITDWMVWNPDFCPEGFENKAYLFLTRAYGTPNAATLLEYDNGDFVRSYDMTKQITDQGGTLPTSVPDNWDYIGEGGKSLRSKDIQRFCWIVYDVNNVGGTYAVIIGGDKNSNINDPFDPSKCIYVKLPATACPGYTAMAATDKAWYVSENQTGRMMRISPNGKVTEYNLSKTGYRSSVGTYIEYTDKNGKPACAFRVWEDTTGGKEAICFFEEREDGGVSFDEVDMAPYTFASGWDSSLWRMMENDYYVFFTAGFGFGVNGDNGFPASATLKKLFYWDKKTHTTHIIDDLYGFPDTWDNGSHLQMYKTREKAIWIAPHVQTLAKVNRTGEFKYILNKDYTNINETTGKDIGAIEVQTATIGTNHPWFTCNNETGWNNRPIAIATADISNISYSTIYQQYACVNDDGIGFLMSPDYKAFALFYGEGNCKVYDISTIDSKAYDYDPNVQQMCPDILENVNNMLHSCEGLKHGWMISGYASYEARGYENMAKSNGFRVYIGLHYKNGEPTILERPTITILRKQTLNFAPKDMYDYYSYLLTYDDYERRRKLMRGIFLNMSYGEGTKGIDSYYEEVEHNANKKINLNYDGKVISSVNI